MPTPAQATAINAKTPKLQAALDLAKIQVREVAALLRKGTGNKPTSPLSASQCVETMWARRAPYIHVTPRRDQGQIRMLADARTRADFAIRAQCGNCEEQTSIALVHLWDQGVEPLDLMYCAGPGEDHCFVVIGRQEGSAPERYSSAWGPDAVVCDPWSNRAYPCSELGAWLGASYPSGMLQSALRLRTINGFAPH